MFLVGIISWWYGHGLQGQIGQIRDRLTATAGYFSIGQLFSTLFSPFRQISAGSVNGPIGAQIRAFFDQTVSRVIGAVVRSLTIFIGALLMVLQVVVETFVLIVWLLLPLLPVAGLIMFVIGWVPKWM